MLKNAEKLEKVAKSGWNWGKVGNSGGKCLGVAICS